MNAAAFVGAGGMLLSGALIVIGALLPWAKAPFGITKVGVEGDGAFTMVAGIALAAAAALYLLQQSDRWHWTSLGVALVASGFVLLVTIADYRDLQRLIDQSGLITAGSGIYLSMIAAGLGLASAVVSTFGATLVDPWEWEDDDEAPDTDSPSSATRLRELQELRAQGLITDEQLADRQQRILDEI